MPTASVEFTTATDGNTPVIVGMAVTVTDGTATSFHWGWDDGTVSDTTANSASHTYADLGHYGPFVVVNFSDGSSQVVEPPGGATGPTVYVRPVNNAFENAIVLTGVSGSVTGNNTEANAQPGEPSPTYGFGANSVWWRWVCPVSGTYIFSLQGSTFDTVLEAFAGTSIGALTLVVANDDFWGGQSQVTGNFTEGVQYMIRVAGYDTGSQGDIALAWFTLSPTLASSGGNTSAGFYGKR